MHNGDPRGNPGDFLGDQDIITLPDMVHDGIEQERLDILRPYAAAWFDEMNAAYEEERATRDKRLHGWDFPDTETYLAWRKENPEPPERVQQEWDKRLGIRPTNNLYVLFQIDPTDRPVIDTEITRKYIAKLEEQDLQFITGFRIASDLYKSSLDYNLELARQGADPSREELIEGQLQRWNCELYATEAIRRIEEMGATEHEIRRLQN
jgi:hypothetical protein